MSKSKCPSPVKDISQPADETPCASLENSYPNAPASDAQNALGPSNVEMTQLRGPVKSSHTPLDTTAGNSTDFPQSTDEDCRPRRYTIDGTGREKMKPARDPNYTEDLSIQKRKLNVWDVTALILNKIIGTGIFTVPGLILELTESKPVSVILWVLGGFYSFLCLIIYLDYGIAMPYNGGELVYLNKVWPTPKLLPAVLYSGFFIALRHTAGNAIAFARHVLLAAHGPSPNEPLHFSKTMVNYVAISILVVVCLMLYFLPRMGLFLNKLLALYKVILLLVMAFAGIAARDKADSGKQVSDWTNSQTGFKSVSALIYVVYSYSGWENANYVIGEIDAAPRTLKHGAFLAVALATLAYTLTTVGYFLACNSREIIGDGSDLAMALTFAEKVFGQTMGVRVSIALSAVGNLIAVVYTSSKVKQAIALHHFLPFSSFFAADDYFGTPGGALLLHAVCSAIVIVAIPNDTDGYGFLLGLLTYGHLAIGVAIGLGFPRLEKKIGGSNPSWKPLVKHRGLVWLAGLSLAILDVFLLISSPFATGPTGSIRRYWWPAILVSVFLASFIYWLLLRQLEGGLGEWIGWKATVVEIDHSASQFEQYQRTLRRDGAETRMVYKLLSGKPVSNLKKIRKAMLDPVYEWLY